MKTVFQHQKLFYSFILLFGLSVSFLTSCSSEPDPADGEFGAGIYVVNEGNFGSTNGSVSFIDRTTGTGYLNIFANANNGLLLGDVVQSLAFNGDKGYIVANNSNKVVVVDAKTFAVQHQITNLELPRYMAVQNNTGYLTEWVSFSAPGQLRVIDLSSNTLVKTYPLDFLPEKLLVKNNRVFVTNSGSNTVSVVDLSQDAVLSPITVGDSPNSIVEDANGKIWVLCGGVAFGSETAGGLYKINPADLTVEESHNFSSATFHPNSLAISGNNLYYGSAIGVYRYIIGGSIEFSPVITRNVYGIGVDPVNGDILIAFAGDFSGAGKAIRYSAQLSAIDSAMTGIGPNGFVFK